MLLGMGVGVGMGMPLVVAQDLAMKIKVFDDECLCEHSRALQELSKAPRSSVDGE